MIKRILLVAVALLVVLLIPWPEGASSQAPASRTAFVWNSDELWSGLQADFVKARAEGCTPQNDATIETELEALSVRLDVLDAGMHPPEDVAWADVEGALFRMGANVAACPKSAQRFAKLTSRLREVAKMQSRQWDLDAQPSKDRLYRLLYGSRTALEEVMTQARNPALALLEGSQQPSVTPSVVVQNVRLHSGDMLVSRGGAPTSAMIARGADHPGNFSHVALVHISEDGITSVVEAHIERGVAISTVDEYLADKKLRLMQVRLRADHPAVLKDPMLPHKAAIFALNRARTEHIRYDFEMNYEDPTELFCSEVASSAYEHFGVRLWSDLSSISGYGLRLWLYSMGVRHFLTEEPSDLEYDPQVAVVTEWRDPSVLADDRIDNAVVDAVLSGAAAERPLPYEWYLLPVVRVMKLYSVALNVFGRVGPIPEGMGATAALRNRRYTNDHIARASRVRLMAEEFKKTEGYPPPYWELVKFAENVVAGP